MAIQNLVIGTADAGGGDTPFAAFTKIQANFAQTLNQGVSPSNGLYPTGSLFQIPGLFNQDVPPIEFFHYGKLGSPVGTELDRTLLPKGIVAINLSMNIVNNWQWDNVQGRAEPFDIDFPMVAIENGGEGVICHYTPPGGIPATSFHEITRFGGGVDGLSGVNPYTTYVPFSQFKTCIYACYSSSTTPPAGTDEAWWGGTGNTLGGLLNPLLWLRSEETKGTDFEFAAFEQNSSNNSPSALYFKKSRGTNQTKTAISSGDSAGRIGWKAYDGDEYHITAFMDAVAAATATNNVAPLDIRFFTSPNTTANFVERLRITNNGSVRSSVPIRGSLSTISGIPSYTAATSLDPTPVATEYANFNAVSTANGGLNIVGLTNTTAGAFPMVIRGIHGSASPTTPSVRIAASKTNGTTNFTDIAATEIAFQVANNATVLTETLGNGNTGFGVVTPTAKVQVRGANNAVSLLVEDDAGNDILSVGESGGALVIGFFGVTPAIRQVVATGSTADQIITALQNLGLFSQT